MSLRRELGGEWRSSKLSSRNMKFSGLSCGVRHRKEFEDVLCISLRDAELTYGSCHGDGRPTRCRQEGGP